MLRNLHVIINRGGLLSLVGGRSRRADPVIGAAGSRCIVTGCSSDGRPSPPQRQQQQRHGSQCNAVGSAMSQKDALTLMSMYLAAIVHDYDHRGVTNAFLIQDQDPLAVRGRGTSRGGGSTSTVTGGGLPPDPGSAGCEPGFRGERERGRKVHGGHTVLPALALPTETHWQSGSGL